MLVSDIYAIQFSKNVCIIKGVIESQNKRIQALEAVHCGKVSRKDSYCEIPTIIFIEKIDLNMQPLPSVAFYILHSDKPPEVIRQPDQPYSLLALSTHQSIWIQECDLQVVREYVESFLTSPEIASKLPMEQRIETIRKSAMVVVDDLFQNPSPENINRSKKVVGSFVHLLMKDPNAYLHLAKLSSHDPYTLQHSVGAAVHSIILARKMGVRDEKDLFEVGLGGLLHDLGKVHVRTEVINKKGPLDEAEWEEMRQHSSAGYELIKDNPNIPERSKRAVLEHHEDKNGTGYPKGLRGHEVDVYSKIVCICDIFNALTTDRTYSKARAPFDAFQLIREKLHHRVDEELFTQLVLVYGGKLG